MRASELDENQTTNFVLPINNSFNRDKMSQIFTEQQPTNVSNVSMAFETIQTQVEQDDDKVGAKE